MATLWQPRGFGRKTKDHKYIKQISKIRWVALVRKCLFRSFFIQVDLEGAQRSIGLHTLSIQATDCWDTYMMNEAIYRAQVEG